MWLINLWAGRQIWKDIEAGKVPEHLRQSQRSRNGGCVGLLLIAAVGIVLLAALSVAADYFSQLLPIGGK